MSLINPPELLAYRNAALVECSICQLLLLHCTLVSIGSQLANLYFRRWIWMYMEIRTITYNNLKSIRIIHCGMAWKLSFDWLRGTGFQLGMLFALLLGSFYRTCGRPLSTAPNETPLGMEELWDIS